MMPMRVAVAVLLLAFAATLWFAGCHRVEPPPARPASGIGAESTAAAAPAAARPAAVATEGSGSASADAQRSEASPSPAVDGPALVGRVVDERGQPCAGAQVLCSPAVDIDPNARDVAAAVRDAMDHAGVDLGSTRTIVTTDAEGRFRLAPRGSGEHVNVLVAARGHEILRRTELRPASADVDLGVLQLQAGAIVAGRVVDAHGEPIAGATVRRHTSRAGAQSGAFADLATGVDAADVDAPAVEGDDVASGEVVRTDAEGRFELVHVPAGAFTLQARHPDHPPASSGELSGRGGVVLRDIVIALAPGATISGVLTGVPAAAPGLRVLARAIQDAGGAKEQPTFLTALFGADGTGGLFQELGQSFGERSSHPGPDGAFVLRGLGVGRTYAVWAVQHGRGLLGTTACSERVEVLAGGSGIVLRYDVGATVVGRVVDAATGDPIERLWIDDRFEGGNALGFALSLPTGDTDRPRDCPGGAIVVTNLRPKPDQTLSLHIDAPGHRSYLRQGIVLAPQATVDLGTIRLDRIPQVFVTVRDAGNGDPVAGVEVSLRRVDEADDVPDEAWRDRHAATTGRNGRCAVNAIVDADVELVASSRSHAPYTSRPLRLSAAGDSERELRLLRGASVEITVLDVSGAPRANVRVERRQRGADDSSEQTDGQGKAMFTRLAAGEHGFRVAEDDGTLVVSFDGQEPAEEALTMVTVADGEQATLELRARAMATLRGVVRENGVALARARVRLLPGKGEADGARDVVQSAVADALGDLGAQIGGGGEVATDEDGTFEFTKVPVGDHRLRIAHRERSMPAIVAVSLREGGNVADVDLDVAALRGTVRDADGQGIAGARVEARPAAPDGGEDAALEPVVQAFGGLLGQRDRGVVSAADGSFELRGVAADADLIVTASKKGCITARSKPVRVERGRMREGVALVLVAGGGIKVTLAETQPFTTVTARRLDLVDAGAPMLRICNGTSCLFDGLQAGRWEVSLQRSGNDATKPSPQIVEVVAGVTATVAF